MKSADLSNSHVCAAKKSNFGTLFLKMLVLLFVGLAACQTLITYGPPSDFQPTGWGIFNSRDFSSVGQKLGARLLTDARICGVLAGSSFSVIYGSFNWVDKGGTQRVK